MKRSDLSALLNEWLQPKNIKDYTLNGLQFEGKGEIKKIAFAVDVSQESLRAAVEAKADALITHHGLIWGGLKSITGSDKERIKILIEGSLNLFCYHLPLDIHPELGNNAVLMNLLGIERLDQPFFEVGYFGSCGMSYAELVQRTQKHVGKILAEMPYGPKDLKRIAFCTGGAGTLPALLEAAEGGADTLFTGESSSIPYHHAKELGINIICAGHYATEVFGVQALQKKIQSLHPELETEFLSLPSGW